MQVTRRRDTPCEMALRSELTRLGLRYRTHKCPVSNSRRQADILFVSARITVFVDGCFWHGCPRHGTWPKKHARWWREKIEANQRRDRDTDHVLRNNGWTVVRLWAHEDMTKAARKIAAMVRRPTCRRPES